MLCVGASSLASAGLCSFALLFCYPAWQAHERGASLAELSEVVLLGFRVWGFQCHERRRVLLSCLAFRCPCQVNCDILIGLLSRAVQRRRKDYEEVLEINPRTTRTFGFSSPALRQVFKSLRLEAVAANRRNAAKGATGAREQKNPRRAGGVMLLWQARRSRRSQALP